VKNSSIVEPEERDAMVALSFVEGVGIGTLQEMHRAGTRYVDALRQKVSAPEAERLHSKRKAVQQRAAEIGSAFLTFLDTEYPQSLLDLEDPPVFLFLMGKRSTLDRPVVSIVGTRSVTRYGDRVTRELAMALASSGACIVSGLARGVDAAAHRGALAVSGHTCAVIGTGIDVVYPAGHATLQRSIAERGCVVSEFLPGMKPFEGSFPRRNRIIAALAPVTIVVEAGRKSGARITSNVAAELGRTVAAVPGPIDSMQSAYTNQLLRDGAQVIATIADALSLVGVNPARADVRDGRELTPQEATLLQAIGERELTTQQLIEVAALPVQQCLAAISTLEVDGLIESSLTGEFRRIAPRSRFSSTAPAQ
jgi:DNA processing protein